MTHRMTLDELHAAGLVVGRNGRLVPGQAPRPAANRFDNCRAVATTSLDGWRHPTKAQARYFDRLLAQRQAGEILGYWPEVSIPFGIGEDGKVRRYRADALVLHEVFDDGRMVVSLVDVKGRNSPVDSNKDKRDALRAQGLFIGTVRI